MKSSCRNHPAKPRETGLSVPGGGLVCWSLEVIENVTIVAAHV